MSGDRPGDEGFTRATPRPDGELEEEATPLPDDSGADAGASAQDEPLAQDVSDGLVVRDSVGNVVKTVEKLPASIGRGTECTVCLEGEGAEGIYARLRRNIGEGVMLEKIRPETDLVSHGISGDTHDLVNGDYFSVDGHVFSVDWPEAHALKATVSSSGRIQPKHVVAGILVMAGLVFALGAFMQSQEPEVNETPGQTQGEESVSVSTAVDDSQPEVNDAGAGTDDQPAQIVIRPLWTLDAMVAAVFGDAEEVGGASEDAGSDSDQNDLESAETAEVIAEDDSEEAVGSASGDEEPAIDTARVGAASRERGMSLYHDGDADKAVQHMRTTASRNDMAGSPEASGLSWLADRVEEAVALSASARNNVADDRLIEAGEQLARLGRMERNTLTPGGLSRYYRELEAELATAVRERMVSAKRADDARESYRWAAMLLDFREDEEAARVVATLDEAARERYDYAFELEMIDVGNATRVWREVVSIVPAESPWHRRAVAKIRQYHPNSE